jgi:outer membrane protein
MTSKIFAMASSAAVLAGASAAYAQAPAAAGPALPPVVTHGAPPPGMCAISMDEVVQNATVGKYLDTRMQQLVGQVRAELQAEGTSLENDAKALQAQRATLDQNTFEQRAAALQVRDNAFQRKQQQRERELQATQQKAVNRLLQEAQAPIRQAYQAKGCAVLLQSNAIAFGLGNPAMDLSPQVITGLNAKITQFTIERERLDQAAAPAQAAPAAARPPAR